MSVKRMHLFAFLIAATLIWGCQTGEQEFIPDVSGIEAEVDIRRFDQALFQLDTNNMQAALEGLMEDYPELGDLYFSRILRANDPRMAPDGPAPYVKGFLQHEPVRNLYDSVQVHYPDLSDIEEELEQAFRFFQYYFPDEPVPTVSTLISEYAVAAFVYGENDLGVSLDYFLGEDYPYQKLNPRDPAFSAYLTRTFNRQHLTSKAIQTLINGLVPPPRQQRLIDLMVNNGKKLYILDKLLPYAPDSVKLEVTGEQVEWLNDNELEMWAFFIKEDLMYETDSRKIRKFVDYSPHSPGMPEEAPGRTANWVGWQIVRAYMQRHPEATMQDLIALEDAQALLDASRYKPGR
ncbi:MAG: hypothetical protein ACE362_14155 [Phaeodactylibacter xiamenensis]|uniref:Gliding motility protein GldB n=1 Tax=Phaeodactylibacter xiamenensis TaxID=1524460 RepID=A0A098SA67_9BACT|nr:hypothetical protein [Phaeodactylibacter xiamenensis]KGE87977.1 hypothetical protein IX84_12745 [Phaeodactylibacter xiamenensis]